jgi:hypothetical protein
MNAWRNTLAVFVLSLASLAAHASKDLSFDHPHCDRLPSASGYCTLSLSHGDFAEVVQTGPFDSGFEMFPAPSGSVRDKLAPWVFSGDGDPGYVPGGGVMLTRQGDAITQWAAVPRHSDPTDSAAYLVQVSYEVMGPPVPGPGLSVSLAANRPGGTVTSARYMSGQAGESRKRETFVVRMDVPEVGTTDAVRVDIRHDAGNATVAVRGVKLIAVDD